MIHALRYEPRGQRQRFEPQEQQHSEREEQDRHLHLHFHLHLTFRARQGRSAPLNVRQVKGMLTAVAAATVIPLWLSPWVFSPPDVHPPTWVNLLGVWSFVMMVAGLALAWGAIGTLLRQSWRASPRERRVLVLPLAGLLLIVLLTAAYNWLNTPAGPPPGWLMLLGVIPYMVVFLAHPLLSTLLLGWVRREARALSQQAPTHRKLGFIAVAGMVLLLLGAFLFNLAFLLEGAPLLLFFPATCIAVIVAIRSRVSTQARPKDVSPSEVAAARSREYYPFDGNNE
jgi:hypothetical protein